MIGVIQRVIGISGKWRSARLKIPVMILGASGMLGAMVTDVLSRDTRLQITATVRKDEFLATSKKRYPHVNWHLYDVMDSDPPATIEYQEWIINAIGITKPYINENNPPEVNRAIQINSVFPYRLNAWAERYDLRVLQIATDCVYSGSEVKYLESHKHDALDVYGKTKSLGEVGAASFHHLRCSIIGPEPVANAFLLAWFLKQGENTTVNGFTNHIWNGVTTLQFARLCQGIVLDNVVMPNLHHVIPADIIDKYELLKLFGQYFDRQDIAIKPVEATQAINRTLSTADEKLNNELWQAAGYLMPPSIEDMIGELATFSPRFVNG